VKKSGFLYNEVRDGTFSSNLRGFYFWWGYVASDGPSDGSPDPASVLRKGTCCKKSPDKQGCLTTKRKQNQSCKRLLCSAEQFLTYRTTENSLKQRSRCFPIHLPFRQKQNVPFERRKKTPFVWFDFVVNFFLPFWRLLLFGFLVCWNWIHERTS
jgi:hypothetical protein